MSRGLERGCCRSRQGGAGEGGHPRSGSVSQAARDAALEAAVQYEKRNPRPSFNGAYSVNLEYVHQEVSA